MEHDLVFAVAVQIADRSVVRRVTVGRLERNAQILSDVGICFQREFGARFGFFFARNGADEIRVRELQIRLFVDEKRHVGDRRGVELYGFAAGSEGLRILIFMGDGRAKFFSKDDYLRLRSEKEQIAAE